MKVHLIFNKDKKFVAFTDDATNFSPNFLIKSIDLDTNEFELSRYRYDGDYDNGKLVDLLSEKKSVVTEDEIHRKYDILLYRKYSISDIILSIHSQEDKAVEIKTFMNKLWEKKQKEIQMYKDSDNYIYETKETQELREKEIFK
jgi:hypothetical protein